MSKINLANYTPRSMPGRTVLTGHHVRLEPMDWNKHGIELAEAITGTINTDLWTYIPFGPFEDLTGLQNVMVYVAGQFAWETMAIIRQFDNKVVGTASYMRIRKVHGSAELGCIIFSKVLQRTPAATEAIYLMSAHLFDDLGYRRNEWKCDNGNTGSKRAAKRFAFQYEGLFRNDLIVKGRNRDTAWFAMTDDDWPNIKAAYQAWLSEDNFDKHRRQCKSLSEFRNANVIKK